MRQNQRTCRSCGDEFAVNERQMERLLASPAFAPELRVSEAEYESRLAVCESCPKFHGGTTCMLCGCLVPVIAHLKSKNCPYPGGSRWAAWGEA
ncbi:DUF6171 family protein [Saccharibacillus alkalitolerans]|uniref:Uncharacterized protein n=1 Tax=Saccharibacillus alkalitolerans TaxID=2705290 RepID=A0ABX0F963_9BACL|nr:DUF6171 family protein [Saccharibacillus alkalitolerans]NGZ75761.1 hypothetical protein [Saccharibacillus alkalitolerans]